jgi:hypothetical protein
MNLIMGIEKEKENENLGFLRERWAPVNTVMNLRVS